MIWWSLIVVCYAANLRDTTLSMAELKETTEAQYQVTVVTQTGGTSTYEVSTYYSVDKLKDAVRNKMGTPKDQQHLFYNGNELLNENMMYNYGIVSGTRIKLEVN